jgi:hypothetical protein
MRNLHGFVLEMSAQVEAGAQGLPSIQTSAHREFLDMVKLTSECAEVTDASEVELKFRAAKILGEHHELTLRSTRFESIEHEKGADRRRS